ncbi:MAG: DNA translocase FtsK 4TM domain-containing protein [Nitrospirae bacterium]|nr:DNA translocase FtsK 4TM domain-containing protein [Nitrospirota bacterium]
MAERIKRVKDEVLGIVSILGGIYIGLSLVTHKKWDPSLFTFTNSSTKNYGGIVGAYMADALLMIIGISAFAIPLFIVVYGVNSSRILQEIFYQYPERIFFRWQYSCLPSYFSARCHWYRLY